MSIVVPNLFRLNYEDRSHWSIFREQLRIFPDSLMSRARVVIATIPDEDIPAQLDHGQLVACAYWGFLPIPRSYKHFTHSIHRITRHTPDLDVGYRSLNTAQMESEAAREFGFKNRDEIKRFFHVLDQTAKDYGFDSLSNAWGQEPSINCPCEITTLSNFPSFLRDFVNLTKNERFTDIAFDEHDDWLMYVHKIDNTAYAYLIDPPMFLHGDFAPHTPEMRPLPNQEAIIALEKYVITRYPDCEFKYITSPVFIGLCHDYQGVQHD